MCENRTSKLVCNTSNAKCIHLGFQGMVQKYCIFTHTSALKVHKPCLDITITNPTYPKLHTAHFLTPEFPTFQLSLKRSHPLPGAFLCFIHFPTESTISTLFSRHIHISTLTSSICSIFPHTSLLHAKNNENVSELI